MISHGQSKRHAHHNPHRPRFSPTAIGFGGNSNNNDDGDNGNIFGFPVPTFGPIVQLPTAADDPSSPSATSAPAQNPVASPATSQSSTPSTVAPLTTSKSSSSSSNLVSTTSTSTSAAPTITSSSLSFTSSQQKGTTTSSTDVAAASANGSAQNTGSSSSAGMVGGVIAGVMALIIICFVVAFIMRRRVRRETQAFHAETFRRSAFMLQDPPPPPHPNAMQQRSFNAPSMSEKQAHMSFGTQYGSPGPYAYVPDPAYGYGATHQHSQQYQQQYAQQYQPQTHPQTPNSSNYLLSPVAPSFQSSEGGSAYEASIHNTSKGGKLLGAQFLARMQSRENEFGDDDRTLSRKTSINTLATKGTRSSAQLTKRMQERTSQYATYPELYNDSARHSVPLPSSDYVDLSRTSVTPFQAAQYFEISKRLSSAPPEGLDTPACDAYMQSQSHPQTRTQSNRLSASEAADDREDYRNNKGSVSPFGDPHEAKHEHESESRRESKATEVTVKEPKRQSKRQSKRESRRTVDSVDLEEPQELDDFPVPPSPTITKSSRYQIPVSPSPPPLLPEIRVQSRSSFGSYDFSAVPPRSSQMAEVPSGIRMSAFPTTPSPLGSSFVIHTPTADVDSFPEEVKIIIPQAKNLKNGKGVVHQLDPAGDTKLGAKSKEADRPVTVYDPEDVYGGF